MNEILKNMNLNELRDEAYSIAKANGWHETALSDEHYLMLVITEIAEAVQADRKDKHADVAKFKEYQGYYKTFISSEEIRAIRFREDFEAYIKNTVEDELADVVIRCLDFAGLRGIDLAHALDSVDELSMSTFDEWTFTETTYDMCFPLVTGNAYAAVISTIEYVFHYCKAKGIGIEWFVGQKMKYNRLRGYRHGGKKY